METTRNVWIGGAIAGMAVPDDSTNSVSNLFMITMLEKRASWILEIEDEFAANFAREGQLEVPERMKQGRKWRLLVLENTGELVSMDAKRQVGQALSRLLNLSERILDQATRLLVLIITNEELGKVHPAVSRPGRCLSRIQFRRLPVDQARRWLERSGSGAEVNSALTLSELYATASGEPHSADTSPPGFVQQNNGAVGKAR